MTTTVPTHGGTPHTQPTVVAVTRHIDITQKTARMRTRIIIDTDDADENPGTPFTLNVYRDDSDGTQSRFSVDIRHENCLIGNDIPSMLRDLAAAWEEAPLDAADRETLND